MTVVRQIACVLAAAALAGCAYTTQSTLDPQYRTIAVNAFQNLSPEYDLQAPLTTAVIRKFTHDGRLDVVNANEADLLLEGVIIDYNLRGLIYDERDEVTQFMCVVAAGARLTDQRTGEVLWEHARITGETTFYTRAAGRSSDRLRGNTQNFLPIIRSFPTIEENQGASQALELLASDIFYRTVQPW